MRLSWDTLFPASDEVSEFCVGVTQGDSPGKSESLHRAFGRQTARAVAFFALADLNGDPDSSGDIRTGVPSACYHTT